jgi:hypothetical protein
MTFRLPASEWVHRTVTPRDSAPVYSKPSKWRNPRLSPSFLCSSVTCCRDMQLEDIVPRLSNCSDNTKAMGQIAPATGQLTHSHR